MIVRARRSRSFAPALVLSASKAPASRTTRFTLLRRHRRGLRRSRSHRERPRSPPAPPGWPCHTWRRAPQATCRRPCGGYLTQWPDGWRRSPPPKDPRRAAAGRASIRSSSSVRVTRRLLIPSSYLCRHPQVQLKVISSRMPAHARGAATVASPHGCRCVRCTFLLPATARFVATAAALPNVSLGVVTTEPAERLSRTEAAPGRALAS